MTAAMLWDQLLSIAEKAVWGFPTLFLLVGIGVYFTVRTRFFQFRAFVPMLQHVFGGMVSPKAAPEAEPNRSEPHPGGTVTPFQSLCTALSATIGTGNIAGVAYAMLMGGAGAVFWMWVAAFIGMILKYAECVLAVQFRTVTPDGVRGGAMVYLEKGVPPAFRKLGRAAAIVFSVSALAASFGMGNMSQVAAMKECLESAFATGGRPLFAVLLGGLVCGATALVLCGGMKRIAAVSERLVPFMAVFYTAGTLVILVCRADRLLPALALIFKEAFSPTGVFGGFSGYALLRTMSWGFRRGIFSNEAGLGSSTVIHAESTEKVPYKQGYWGIFEVFFDTCVICTLTALVLLVSGVLDGAAYGSFTEDAGLALAGKAFASVFGRFGNMFVAFAVTFFAFSSILGWSFYGMRAWEYLFGKKSLPLYKLLFAAAALPGALWSADTVLRLSDVFNGCMALPNLVGLLVLSETVISLTPDRNKHPFASVSAQNDFHKAPENA